MNNETDQMKKLDLKEIQQRELEIFQVFTGICEKYGIPHVSTGDIFRENIRNNT